MKRLLSAGFNRLFRNRLFLAAVAVLFILGIFAANTKRKDMEYREDVDLTDTLFSCAYMGAFAIAAFTPLFSGTEYSDGVIRNKLIAGHRRRDIYLSNQILTTSAGLLLMLAFAVPHSIFMLIIAGPSVMPPTKLLMLVGISVLSMAAHCAIFTAVTMLCSRKAYSAVACLLLIIAGFVAAMTVHSRLGEPEQRPVYTMTVDGKISDEIYEPNPRYITGAKRRAYEAVYDLIPLGQNIQVLWLDVERPAAVAAYALALSGGLTLAGVEVFKRKDIK